MHETRNKVTYRIKQGMNKNEAFAVREWAVRGSNKVMYNTILDQWYYKSLWFL